MRVGTYGRKTKRMGLLGPWLGSPLPAQIDGVRQLGGPSIPLACPHCHASIPAWNRGDWLGHCRICGCTFHRTVYRASVPVPHKGNRHPVPLPNMR